MKKVSTPVVTFITLKYIKKYIFFIHATNKVCSINYIQRKNRTKFLFCITFWGSLKYSYQFKLLRIAENFCSV